MADYGVTAQGFVRKPLVVIKQELEQEIRDLFGDIRTDPQSGFGQLIGVFASREADWWELAEKTYNSNFPASASGVSLDNAVSLTGTVRTAAQAASLVVQMEGDEGAVIPSGTQVSDTETGFIFSLLTETTITESNLHKAVYTVDSDTEASYSITINGVVSTFTLSGGESATDIAAGLASEISSNLSGDVTATNEGASVIVVIDDSDDVSSFFEATAEGTGITLTEIWTPGLYECTVTGDVNVPAGGIDTIETPVTGFDQADNIAASFGGSDVLTDDQLRIKQQNELQGANSATLLAIKSRVLNEVDGVTEVFVFQNDTDTVDGEGRPPNSIEVVVEGGLESEIAQKIFDVKSAGIETFGSEVENVIDPNGDTQVAKFNRPTPVDIYMIVEIIQNDEETLPSNFASLIENSVLETGEALDIGEDVILQRFFGPIYSSVSGIASITIKADTSPAPSATTNIAIAAREFARFTSANVTVTDVTP
jgi:uncharacterized phage protein gp47/JayE